MEEDLVTRIVGGSLPCADRVSWTDRARGDGLSSITLSRIARHRIYSHDGPAALQDVRIQFDIWASSPAEAEAMETAIIELMEPPATVGSTSFGASFLNDSPDLPPETIEGGVRVFRRAPDIQVYYQPA